MSKRRNRFTVILVPQTAERTYSFTFNPAWLAALTILVGVLAGGLWYYQRQTAELQANLVELEELRRTTRLQQEEILRMQESAREVQSRLQEITQLEQEIKAMTGEEAPAPSRSSEDRTSLLAMRGRGGADPTALQKQNPPTLASLLPADVKPYVIGRRDTLALDLQLGRVATDSTHSLEAARATAAALDEHISALEQSKTTLGEGREEVAEHLEYLAHRPSGWPIYGASISDRFGSRWSPFGWGEQFHDGLDLAQDYWEPIYATARGVVTHAGWLAGGYGNAVAIDHGYGFETLYAHMVDWNVTEGEEVSRGDLIGWVGNTGLSTGPHLHYEVHKDGVAVDPVPYLD